MVVSMGLGSTLYKLLVGVNKDRFIGFMRVGCGGWLWGGDYSDVWLDKCGFWYVG
ncbi:hypothetical protein [Candidatus Hodgkinia cicadicola]|uniref:hypothetical protein n=1 Tax=Candidatus Hodgkinia cicadicola TaxID=573658 RepID=UPI001788BFF1